MLFQKDFEPIVSNSLQEKHSTYNTIFLQFTEKIISYSQKPRTSWWTDKGNFSTFKLMKLLTTKSNFFCSTVLKEKMFILKHEHVSLTLISADSCSKNIS